MIEYQNEYRRLEAVLKVSAQDFAVLHHNVIGAPELHDWLGDLYEEVNDFVDELVEVGIQIGVSEIGIKESCDLMEPLQPLFRNKQDTLSACIERLEALIGIVGGVRDTMSAVESADDLTSMLDDFKIKLRRWDYKFRMVLEGVAI